MSSACMIVLLSVLSVCCVLCHPAKPLDERSTELAWEAWLLVDQSNRQSDLGMLRRRITPKSVFIAPTFSPESLPACAEGYKSDTMGRCVKIFKIDPSGHFDFLLQKLNAQFSDYEDATESATHGPLQLNIPLFPESEEKMLENETEVAIVVTPSRGHEGHHHHHKASVKVDVKRDGETFDVEDVAAILGVKPEDVEMTTIAELSTTVMATTLRSDDVTTLPTTTEVATTEIPSTTTEDSEATTLFDGEALFFQI